MNTNLSALCVQTGGDVLILEEAAYCDEGFFYETVAPILSIGTASLVAISTLTSEINFYTVSCFFLFLYALLLLTQFTCHILSFVKT